ncbi:MAG: glycosyltransferase family 2 protein [Candidatus Woesearchaeota archaeon]
MVLLTILIPVYNEEKRIPPFLFDLEKFFKKNKLKNKFEVIFINDGSIDNSENLLKRYCKKNNFFLINLKKNVGKAGALKEGIRKAKGDYILFIDADNSISPIQIEKVIPFIGKYDLIIGSRANKKSIVKQSFLRRITSSLFNPYVRLLFRTGIKDHLCGFKALKKEFAKEFFEVMISDRWIFDVEMLFWAKQKGLTIKEIPVKWIHKEGSKMTIFDPIKIAYDLIKLRWNLRSLK